MQKSECEIVVIGGGMVGASIAAHLAERADVRLLEMESQPGYHSTGRSAAMFTETDSDEEAYGSAPVRALIRASHHFFFSPPDGFVPDPLLKNRPVLVIARHDQAEAFDAFAETVATDKHTQPKSADEAVSMVPMLRADALRGAVLVQGAEIDVGALLQGYLRLFKRRGGKISYGSEVSSIERVDGLWRVTTKDEQVQARVVVNAAGAWAGDIGKLAGALDIGLQPYRRTALLLDPPPGSNPDEWPFIWDIGEEFYVKPDAGKLLLSPNDETPSAPCDAQADDMDVAIAVDRIERATTLQVRRVEHTWAGLRSFVADRSPVIGYDPIQPNFFWAAAVGGFGIQTAPAVSRLGASLVFGAIDAQAAAFGLTAPDVSPSRLQRRSVSA